MANEPARRIVDPGTVEAHSPTVHVQANMWRSWGLVAVRHAGLAREARQSLVAAWEHEDGAIRFVHAEKHASMVCVVATASALDALHFEVAPLVGRDPDYYAARRAGTGGSGRMWGYHLETFRSASPLASRRQPDLEWLVVLRDGSIHPTPEQHVPLPHPAIPTNIDGEAVLYATESCERAVVLLLGLLGDLLKSSVPGVQQWAARQAGGVQELVRAHREANAG